MKKIISIIVSLVLLIGTFEGTLAFDDIAEQGQDAVFTAEVSNFMKENNIDRKNILELKNSLYDIDKKVQFDSTEEVIKNLKIQAEQYGFTKEQIVAYIDGLISTPTKIVNADSVRIKSSKPYSTNRPTDNGIGYEVKSKSGYYQETAFLKLPTVYRSSVDGSSGYLFYTISNETETYGIDIGLWYGFGDGGYGWRDCYTINGQQQTYKGLLGVNAGDVLYLQGYVTTGDDGETYVRCRVLNGNDFSDVKTDFSVWVGNGIKKTTAVIDRQISLCNNTANFNTGEYLHNAEFYDAYLYKTTENGQKISASNTKENYCGAFGTNNNNREQVTVHTHSMWDAEKVSIDF